MKYSLALLLLLTLFLLTFQLGQTPLTNWDEAWFASVAQDMASRNDFLVGYWNGNVWFYEPPILTWILAISLKLFGHNSFFLRLGNAATGFFTIVTINLLTKEITKSRRAALFAGLILLSNIEFLFRSRQINVEVPVGFFLLFAFYSCIKAVKTQQTRWFICLFVSWGLAFLTKRASPILIAPAIVYCLFQLRPWFWQQKKFYLGLLCGAWVTLPWYIANWIYFGDQFIRDFFITFTLGKLSTPNPGSGTSLFFYFVTLKHSFKVWVMLLPIAFLFFVGQSRKWEMKAILIYIVTFFTLLTLASNKTSWFLVPLYPLFSLVIAYFLDNFCRHTKTREIVIISGVFLIFFLQVVHFRTQFIVPDTTSHQVTLAKKVKSLTKPEEVIYLDDEYLPVAVFYSGRNVYPLRFNRILLANPSPLEIPKGSYVLTNTETMDQLQSRLTQKGIVVERVRDLLLMYILQK